MIYFWIRCEVRRRSHDIDSKVFVLKNIVASPEMGKSRWSRLERSGTGLVKRG